MMTKIFYRSAASIAFTLAALMLAPSAASAIGSGAFDTPEEGDVICETTFTVAHEDDESNPYTVTLSRSIVLDADYAEQNRPGECGQFVYPYDPDQTDTDFATVVSTFSFSGVCDADLGNCTNRHDVLVAIDDSILPSGNSPINCLSAGFSDNYRVSDSGENIVGGGSARCIVLS